VGAKRRKFWQNWFITDRKWHLLKLISASGAKILARGASSVKWLRIYRYYFFAHVLEQILFQLTHGGD